MDEIVTFAPLSPESLKRIAALMLGEYKEPLAAKGIGLSWTEAALAPVSYTHLQGKAVV